VQNRTVRTTVTSLLVGAALALAVPTYAEAPPTAKPKADRITNSIGMTLTRVSAGKFLFFGKKIQSLFLFPQPVGFQVTIDREFYIGVHEVTQAQYQQIMGTNPSAFKGPNRPVERVSWKDAMAFCRRLSALASEKEAGRVYSLPTEREWQYAARAGSEFLFPYGSDDETRVSRVAVCRDSYTDALPKRTAAVGTKKPNAWGLHDVLGNVWEWVLDAIPSTAGPQAVNRSGKNIANATGDNRVIVGGGWDNDSRACNLAARYGAYPARKANNIGFRVRCLVKPAPASQQHRPKQ